MLHAALIGFPSTGKSTLFQLMTSAKDAPRGKGDTAIGISKVPDVRLDKLTAIFNPKKTRPGDDRVHRHHRARAQRRRRARRCRRLQECRRARARRARVSRSRGAASRRLGRSGARCAGDGRRIDPRRPRRRRTTARAHGEGSQEEQVGRARQGKRAAAQVQDRARERPAAARARPCR